MSVARCDMDGVIKPKVELWRTLLVLVKTAAKSLTRTGALYGVEHQDKHVRRLPRNGSCVSSTTHPIIHQGRHRQEWSSATASWPESLAVNLQIARMATIAANIGSRPVGHDWVRPDESPRRRHWDNEVVTLPDHGLCADIGGLTWVVLAREKEEMLTWMVVGCHDFGLQWR